MPIAALMKQVNPLRDACILAAYCGFIFLLSHQSTLPVSMMFQHQDKLTHAGAYAVMGGLAWLSFRHLHLTVISTALVALIFTSFYGLTDEYHQSFIQGRQADVWDWLADTTGALLMLGFIIWRKRRSC